MADVILNEKEQAVVATALYFADSARVNDVKGGAHGLAAFIEATGALTPEEQDALTLKMTPGIEQYMVRSSSDEAEFAVEGAEQNAD